MPARTDRDHGLFSPTVGARAAPPDALLVTDLLADLPELVDRLVRCTDADDALDAFLLAAGAVQIVEDHLQRDVLSLRRAGGMLGGGPRHLAGLLAEGLETVRRLPPGNRRALRWCEQARRVRDLLADAVAAAGAPGERHRDAYAPGPTGLQLTVRRLAAEAGDLPPALRSELLRMPSCFRSFDLAPADMGALAERLLARPDRAVGGCVIVGIRTSGSYLAPLVAAELRRRGTPASALTVRPSRLLLPGDGHRLRTAVAAGATVAVVDDPPNTGSAYRKTIALLARHGAPRPVLLLPLFGDDPPAGLTALPAETLPYRHWAVHRQLDPAAVRAALAELLGLPAPLLTVRQLSPTPSSGERGHLAVTYAVDVDGRSRLVEVAGSGQGYLGRHAIAVAAALSGLVAPTYGFRDGLVYRATPAPEQRLTAPTAADAAEIARHVHTRAAALPAVTDRSLRMNGQQPVWELAARLTARGFGRAGLLLRQPVLDPAARRLCRPDRPSVIDGATSLSHWYRDGDGRLRKTDPDTKAFANTDRASYDARYDLAGAAPGGPDDDIDEALRAGPAGGAEAYLLYELVHLQDPITGRPADAAACSRAVRRYLTRLYPAPPVAAGPLCALDLDGVVESDALGFPITTPTALRAVHALSRHGFRPVPVTGRSLPDVWARCAAYGLAGGVAEYGAVAYRHDTATTVSLLGPDRLAVLDRLRIALRARPGVSVDDAYRHSVRVRRAGGGPVSAHDVDGAVAEAGADPRGLRVITGAHQTDIVDAGTGKLAGVHALVDLLGGPVEFAVGDSAEDLPMLTAAWRGYAPGNASQEIRAAGVRVLRPHYARGLAAAVGRVIGHRPGACRQCAAPRPKSADARLLLAILDVQAGGRRGLGMAAARAVAARFAR
ncbi:HAD hydrolase family protein [Pseudonocardia acidicola]|uniref:HAD hydrolase family protein n=1 Tax=Pseudonocardia acidicola TaxID=2724939 RepID=A0ABX1SGW7_9PSEU|nr:HAD hydrolase family protein [Pseudonocardia acidicola]NMH99807.1 HAD hydrolase family protein [Pseudonocardia acidicola]